MGRRVRGRKNEELEKETDGEQQHWQPISLQKLRNRESHGGKEKQLEKKINFL